MELRFVRLEIADGAHNDEVRRRNFQYPKIVLDPGAGFDLDCAHNPELSYGFPERLGYGDRQARYAFSRGIRDALGPGSVKEVDVCVDDGNWRRLCPHAHCGSRGGSRQELSSTDGAASLGT